MSRWRRLFHSLRWRLVATYLSVALITLLLGGVLALLLIRQQMTQRERIAATDVACNVAEAALPLYEGALHERGKEVTEALVELAGQSAHLYGMEIRLLDPSEQPLAVAPRPAAEPQLVQVQTVTGTATIELLPGQPVVRDGARIKALNGSAAPPRSEETGTCPVLAAGEDRALGYVSATGGPDLVEPALGAAREGLATAGIMAAVAALLLGLFASYRLSRPLLQLTETAAEMSRGNLGVRAPGYGRDEVGRLALQFNEMAAQVEETMASLEAERDALRRFMSDASHELRTPLTALRSFNELLREGADYDQEVRAEFLAESGAQIERMVWIVEHLLSLSRLDAGVAVMELELCRAADLLEEAANPFTWRAKEAALTFHVELPSSDLLLSCDRARILLALGNLLDNALKFTPPGGCIEVGAGQVGEEVHFWVRDSGPGIPPDVHGQIFERFYRADRRRPGSGLGLALVKSVVSAHAGRVSVTSEPGEGSEFAIILPA